MYYGASIATKLTRFTSVFGKPAMARIIDIASIKETGVEEVVTEAATILLSGGIVALPTDTVYGIACSVNSTEGIQKLYKIKGRNADNPIAICVADVDDMLKWADVTVSQTVLENLLPGKLTAVFTRKKGLNVCLNPGTHLIGIRIPDNDFIRRLVRCCQYPIALTSANKSGCKSTLQIEEFEELWQSINLIIDQGRICDPNTPNCRAGSTVVDLSSLGFFSIIRNGRYGGESRKSSMQKTYFITNKGNSCRRVRLAVSKNSSDAFSLHNVDECCIAAGLSMPVILVFMPLNSYPCLGEIEVFSEGSLLYAIPITALPPHSCFEITPLEFDFGTQVNENQIVSRRFTIKNSGKTEGSYSVHSELSHFEVSSASGVIKSNQTHTLTVQLQCNFVGDITEYIRFNYDNGSSASLKVKCIIMQRTLEIIDFSDNKTVLNRVSFRNLYYGDTDIRRVIIFNNSPINSNYLITVNPKKSRSIIMGGSLALTIKKGVVEETCDLMSLFQISPSQGTLGPYQKSVIEFKFLPQIQVNERGWKTCQRPPPPKEYNVMVNIILVDVYNQIGDQDGGLKMIALFATARPVSVKVFPQKIKFGACVTGSTVSKELLVANDSDFLPIKYKCQELAHYKLSTSSGIIKRGESTSIRVTFQPKQLGSLNHQLVINFWAADQKSFRTDSVVSSVVVSLKGTSRCFDNMSEKGQSMSKLARLDDLPRSIRPSFQGSTIITPFTKVSRYTYIDTDYRDMDKVVSRKENHKSVYVSYLRQHYAERKWKEKEKKDLAGMKEDDMGMSPGSGLQAPTPTISIPNGSLHRRAILPSAVVKTSDGKDVTVNKIKSPVHLDRTLADKGLVANCDSAGHPNQLEQVVIEPSALSFGHVFVGSIMEKSISVKNLTKINKAITFETGGAPLQFTSFPEKMKMDVFLRPSCCTSVGFSLMQAYPGQVQRSMKYTINKNHTYSIPVTAVIDELTLQVSSRTVAMMEPCSCHVSAGLWGSLELKNDHDVPIAFKWNSKEVHMQCSDLYPINQTGVIPGNSNMVCAFSCTPGYSVSSSQDCELYVGCGSEEEQYQHFTDITFIIKLQKSECTIRQKRILFSTIPLNLVSSQRLSIDNKSDVHAYFKVLDDGSGLNMDITPSSGCVPAKGVMELEISLHPTVPGSFDTEVYIGIRESKPLLLRVTGSVEMPKISVVQECFDFGGVLCGSTSCLPYVIKNQGYCRAQLTFDFSCLPDFTLKISDEAENISWENRKNVYQIVVELSGKSTTACELEFRPSEVASYDLFMTVLVNGLLPHEPPESPWPPCNAHSFLTIIDNFSAGAYGTPIRKVLATAIQSPLLISNKSITFSLPPTLDCPTPPVQHQNLITLENVSTEAVSWALDTSQCEHLKRSTFKFLHPESGKCIPPPQPDDPKYLKHGEKCGLRVMFKPEHFGNYHETIPLLLNGCSVPHCDLSLSAVLLNGSITTTPSCIVLDPVPMGVTVKKEFIIVMNGFEHVELDVLVPQLEDGVCCAISISKDCQGNEVGKKCQCVLEFSSTVPISRMDFLIVTERSSGQKSKIPFAVTADNSIFSVYEFLAQNSNPVITLNEGNAPVFHFHSHRKYTGEACLPCGAAADFKKMHLKDCVSSICRWISFNGFSSDKCVNTPIQFCSKIVKDISNLKVKEKSCVTRSRGMLVDMLTHLCGRVPPGIPLYLPPCTTRIGKIIQQYSTYETVLTFLRNQGGVVSGVLPEALLDYDNYLEWIEQQSKSKYIILYEDETSFKEASERAWTCVLMQAIKVLVIPQLVSRQDLHQEVSQKCLVSFKSNVYSDFEMKLLTWLNHHFKLHKDTLFGLQDSNVQARQLVHFDVDLMDSMALSCVLYSYCPFLQSTHFDKLYVEPSTPEQCAHNAVIFVDALKTIGLNYDVLPSDILSPNPIFMILFCAHLYSVLSTYKAVDSIRFPTTLGKTSERKICVRNPSSSHLEYHILIRGYEQKYFTSCSNLSLHVPQQSSRDLLITYHCHSLCVKEAYLLLVAVNRHPSVSTKSYSLQGSCTGAVPKLHKKVWTHLYEFASVDIPVNKVVPLLNGNFEINLFEMNCSMQGSQGDNSPSFVSSSSLRKRTQDEVKLFHHDTSSTNFGSANSTSLTLQFVGIMMGVRQCFVLLSSPEQPDFVFSATVEVKQPLPILPSVTCYDHHTCVNTETKTLNLSTYTGHAVHEDITVYPSNNAFENALIQMTKWDLDERESRQLILTGSLKYATLSSELSASSVGDIKRDSDGCMVFTVEGSDTQHFSLPPVVTVSVNGSTKLPIKFTPKSEGLYKCHVLMRSGHDVRLLLMEATVLSKERLTKIEFKTHATLPLTQNIPLVNPSTSDWLIKASISTPQFSGPDTFRVGSLTTTCYPLTYHPQKEGIVNGELRLINTKNFSEHIFDLAGIAERPLAQECISIRAKVKERLVHLFHVPNHMDRTVTFQVESDLDFIRGPEEVTIEGNDKLVCPITILPKRRGMFSGALVFVAKNVNSIIRSDFKQKIDFDTIQCPHFPTSNGSTQSQSKERVSSFYYIWFKVDCEVEPRLPEQIISASCPIFTSRFVQIPNALNESNVTIECDYVTGPATFSVPPSEDLTYSVTFSPLSVGVCNGRIIFYSSTDGEFWYELHLEALDPDVIHIPLLECEIGRSCRKVVTLRNPLDREVSFSCSNPNTRHYSVASLAQGTIDVAPHSQRNVTVLFYSSSLGSSGHHVDLTFTSRALGQQVFDIQGSGVMPKISDATVMESNINSSAAHTISFRNPLKSSTRLCLYLKGKDLSNFKLLTRQSNKSVIVKEGETIDIALVFSPKELHKHEVVFSISTDVKCSCDSCAEPDCGVQHRLCWDYPIVGQPQVLLMPVGSAPKINCHAKKPIEKVMAVHLRMTSKTSNARFIRSQDALITRPCCSAEYAFNVKCDDESLLSVIKHYLQVNLLGECDDKDAAYPILLFNIIFSPTKAFNGTCNLCICNSEGGVWVLPLQLCVLSAYPDDLITIESAGLNVLTQTSFCLTSTSLASIPFTAYVVGGSDPEISVTPTSGTLSPCNTRGTRFVVSYKPIMYGKRHHAKFVIQCDVAEWCYEIIGKLPNMKYPHSHPITQRQHIYQQQQQQQQQTN